MTAPTVRSALIICPLESIALGVASTRRRNTVLKLEEIIGVDVSLDFSQALEILTVVRPLPYAVRKTSINKICKGKAIRPRFHRFESIGRPRFHRFESIGRPLFQLIFGGLWTARIPRNTPLLQKGSTPMNINGKWCIGAVIFPPYTKRSYLRPEPSKERAPSNQAML